MRPNAGPSDAWLDATSELTDDLSEVMPSPDTTLASDGETFERELTERLAASLARGEPTLVLAARATWSLISRHFEAGFFDLPGSLEAGHCRHIAPEENLAEEHVRAVVQEMRSQHPRRRLRVLCEGAPTDDAATLKLTALFDLLGAEPPVFFSRGCARLLPPSTDDALPPVSERSARPRPAAPSIRELDPQRVSGVEHTAAYYLTRALEQLPVAVALCEASSGNVVFANRKHEELFGASPPPSLADCARLALETPSGAPSPRRELPLTRKDGTEAIVRVSASPVRDESGALMASVIVADDVTSERRAAALREEEHRISQALLDLSSAVNRELSVDAIVGTLTDHATSLCRAEFGAFFYTVVDDQGERFMLYSLSGADRSVFDGMPMPRNTELFRPIEGGTSVVRVDDVTRDPRYGKLAPHHGMPNGHLPVRSYLAAPVKSRAGRVIGGFFLGHSQPGVFQKADEDRLMAIASQAAIGLDNAALFKEAQRAQALAHRERQKMQELFMQSPALIVVLKGPEHVYDFVNAAAAELIGQRSVIGKPLREVLPDMPEERRALVDRVYRTGERYTNESLRAVRVWGREEAPRERFFNVVYEAYRGEGGAIEGVMSFGFEVTEQVTARRKLEAIAHELEEANRTKDEFLAMVSHELRTPLNAILGWVRLLRLGTLSPEKQAHALETIERNASTQTQLIEDLLDVGRIVSGKLRLELATVEVAAVIEGALGAVQHAAAAKGVSIFKGAEPAVRILGDATRLQQVVWNLLANAVKFTPRGGSVKVGVTERGSFVDVVVSDTGQGIAPEFLPRVFERFRQADSTTTRKQGGLGLGLAIVRHIVELHGGSVRVASEGLGSGATFTVSLPLAPQKSVSSDSLPALRLTGRGPSATARVLDGVRVLIVDDEADARDVLLEMLQTFGATVTAAGSAEEALRLLREQRPHLLVSDIGMPGQDGYELIRQIRKLPKDEGGRVPAIALTAYTRFEDRARALVAGFSAHTSKPVDPTELVDMISGLVRAK